MLMIRGVEASEREILELRSELVRTLNGAAFEGTVTVQEAHFERATRPPEPPIRMPGRDQAEHVQRSYKRGNGRGPQA